MTANVNDPDPVAQVAAALMYVARFRLRRIVRAFLPPGALSDVEAREVEAINAGRSSRALWPDEHTLWVASLETGTGEVLGVLFGEWGESAGVVERRLAEAVVASAEWRQRGGAP